MIRLFLFFLTFLTLFFSGCSLNDDEPNFHFKPLVIVDAQLPESFVLGERYEIPVTFMLPDGCTGFWEFNVTQEAQTSRNVVVFGIVRTDQEACIQIVTEETKAFTFEVLYEETYVFRFWQGESEDGDQDYFEVEVPVSN